MPPLLIALLTTAAATIVGLLAYLRVAPALGLIDRPNARSLHDRPTVVGAGAVVVAAILTGWASLEGVAVAAMAPLAGLVLVLTVTGLLDDRFNLPSGPRLLLYGVVVAAAIVMAPTGVATLLVATCLALGWLWLINLFNFMDGADGFAALQALLVALGMGLLCQWGPAPRIAELWWVFCVALLPFLWVNWPPARCFLGDAGSVPLGFLLGWAGWASAVQAPELGAAWLVLMMPFIVDATGTLLLRLMAGHPPQLAHRDHAYQRAARHFGSPLPVNLTLAALHLLWQFPLAMTAVQAKLFAPIPVILSAIPTALLLAYARRAA